MSNLPVQNGAFNVTQSYPVNSLAEYATLQKAFKN